MTAYNFQDRFAPEVEKGTKRQTIRSERHGSGHAMAGDPIELYTGQRTPNCRLIGRGICTLSAPIEIDDQTVKIKGFRVADPEAEARADGFASFDEMKRFFVGQYGPLPFVGRLIVWTLTP